MTTETAQTSTLCCDSCQEPPTTHPWKLTSSCAPWFWCPACNEEIPTGDLAAARVSDAHRWFCIPCVCQASNAPSVEKCSYDKIFDALTGADSHCLDIEDAERNEDPIEIADVVW